jgi:hypothetical protein
MSTADKKAGHGAAWANLVICGGLSWGVNLWHATHTTSGSAKVGVALALLCATGPVVSAGFASHNMAKSGGGNFKKVLTYIVFAMGMALSITAQAEAVQGVFGNIGFGVTFALMLDLSAFMSLHSIMTAPSARASTDASDSRLVDVRADASATSAVPSVRREPERLPDASPAPSETSARTSRQTSAKPAKKTQRTTTGGAKKKLSLRDQVRPILIENPEMTAADVARKIGREPTGHIRTTCGNVLAELIESGEIAAPPLRIAQ